jgi:hypothetical protein
MQIRVKNMCKGSRGLYISGDLTFVNGGDTATFNDASAAERDAAAAVEGLKVQSRQGDSGDWTDHFKEEMPQERPWIAIATDKDGTNFKPLTNADGAWYIGMAVGGERPDSAGGYKWVKVGGDMEAGEPQSEEEPVATDFDALVAGNAADVIKAITKDNAAQIGDAEEKRDGGPRKGVMKAVEDAMED